MKSKKMFGLTLALLLISGAVYCEEEAKEKPKFGYPVRIDVIGRVQESPMTIKKVPGPSGRSPGAYFLEATWRKDYNDDYLTCSFPADKLEWQEGFMCFIPGETGKVTIMFRGEWEKDEYGNPVKRWALVDNVRIDGGAGKNLDFEDIDAKGKLKEWTADKNALVSDNAKRGKNSVKVWFQSTISQDIMVEKDKPVKIEFWYCPLPDEKSE